MVLEGYGEPVDRLKGFRHGRVAYQLLESLGVAEAREYLRMCEAEHDYYEMDEQGKLDDVLRSLLGGGIWRQMPPPNKLHGYGYALQGRSVPEQSGMPRRVRCRSATYCHVDPWLLGTARLKGLADTVLTTKCGRIRALRDRCRVTISSPVTHGEDP